MVEWLRESPGSFCGISWTANRGGPHYGIYDEYPIHKSFSAVWDETENFFEGGWPGYEWMKKNIKEDFKIPDIAIQHKGMIAYVIEIVHKNDLSKEKIDFYKSLLLKPEIIAIPAQWILGQVTIPTKMPSEFFIN